MILLFAALLPRQAWATCDGAPGTSGVITLEVAGAVRTSVVRLPVNYDGRAAAPVMFLFHPFGMNAQYMQTRVPAARTWPELITIYPDGLARDYGELGPSWQNAPGDLNDRDLQFFDAMLAWLRAHACFDEKRVFVLGYSNGAQFANVLACERASIVAGAAIASGRLTCKPPQPKPVIISHGTSDRVIAYDQAILAAQSWSTRNGCTAPPKAGVAGCFEASGCATSPVQLCTYAGGHEFNPPFTAAAVEFLKRAEP
jgi:polyhydroxybutyrate depolymerase